MIIPTPHSESPALRTRLNVSVSFRRRYGRQDEFGSLKNISETGAFLAHSDQPIPAGSKAHITLDFAGHRREIVAEVIWSSHAGSGIRFLPHVGRDQLAVDDFIAYIKEIKAHRSEKLALIFKKVA